MVRATEQVKSWSIVTDYLDYCSVTGDTAYEVKSVSEDSVGSVSLRFQTFDLGIHSAA